MIGKESTAGRATKFTFLGLWLVFTVFPLYWITITSLKAPGDIFAFPIAYWPEHFSLENYSGLFGKADFGVYLTNSLIVAFVAGAVATAISMLSAYVLARFEFRYGRSPPVCTGYSPRWGGGPMPPGTATPVLPSP
ncbi:hypothetical protein ACIBCS_43640, partial [Streptomyces phaeochromogenes]